MNVQVPLVLLAEGLFRAVVPMTKENILRRILCRAQMRWDGIASCCLLYFWLSGVATIPRMHPSYHELKLGIKPFFSDSRTANCAM